MKKGFKPIFPPINLCSDNAAMIAWAGIEKFRLNLTDKLNFPARARWPLDENAPFMIWYKTIMQYWLMKLVVHR